MISDTILVVTNFSPVADHALTYAAALAAAVDAQLLLLYVRPEAAGNSNTGLLLLTDEELTAAVAERTAHFRVSVTVEVASSAQPLAETIQRYQPALIVLGKPNPQLVTDDVLTSTALSLLNPALIPLLIVPAAGVVAVPPKEVMLAADKLPVTLKASNELVIKFLQALDPHMTVVHVVEPEDDDSCTIALTMLQDSGLFVGLSRIRSLGFRDLHTTHGIQQAATETNADLLILIARHRNFLGKLFHQSVTMRVARYISRPLLILPADI